MEDLATAHLEELQVEASGQLRQGNGKAARREIEAEVVSSNDAWTYRFVVIILGTVATIAAVGPLVLGMAAKQVPEVMVALASGALGALAGLVAPSPRK